MLSNVLCHSGHSHRFDSQSEAVGGDPESMFINLWMLDRSPA